MAETPVAEAGPDTARPPDQPSPPGAATGPDRLDDEAVEARLARIDELLDGLQQMPGPTAESAVEAVALLTEVYGEGLARVLGWVGHGVLSRCADDQLVRHLMVLHDLHPDSVEQRVRRVLDDIRPQLEAHGGQLELTDITDGVARVRIAGGGGCGGGIPADELTRVVTDSVLALAPELATVEAIPGEPAGQQVVIPVEALLHRPGDAPTAVPAAGARP
jgi:Fe-S cluster biogenesis protein NfuA